MARFAVQHIKNAIHIPDLVSSFFLIFLFLLLQRVVKIHH